MLCVYSFHGDLAPRIRMYVGILKSMRLQVAFDRVVYIGGQISYKFGRDLCAFDECSVNGLNGRYTECNVILYSYLASK